MKAYKKIMAAALALVMLLTLCACGEDKPDEPGTASYQVTVLDGQGNPITSGVVVKFMKNGQQVAMQKTDSKGVATKELEKGDYTVELVFTDSNKSGYYDAATAVLSAKKTTLKLSLVNKLNTDSVQELTVSEKTYAAYAVSTGSTYVPLKASERNYFLFSPAEAGTYEFSVDNKEIKLGYYGGPHFVQSTSAVTPINNVLTLSISAGSLGGTYVIGLDGVSQDTNAVLSIIRTGDPQISISDMPWNTYPTTHTPSPYTLNLGGKSLKYVDVTGKTEDNKIVFNESDGYYHYRTANGPVVLVHLGPDAPYYSLQFILNLDGSFGQHGSKICEYFFDSDGNFLKKEDYSDILSTYFANMDQKSGVYPLTDDLKYIIQNGCKQWWDKNDPDYSEDFAIPNCNPEIAWMFALCYVA